MSRLRPGGGRIRLDRKIEMRADLGRFQRVEGARPMDVLNGMVNGSADVHARAQLQKTAGERAEPGVSTTLLIHSTIVEGAHRETPPKAVGWKLRFVGET